MNIIGKQLPTISEFSMDRLWQAQSNCILRLYLQFPRRNAIFYNGIASRHRACCIRFADKTGNVPFAEYRFISDPISTSITVSAFRRCGNGFYNLNRESNDPDSKNVCDKTCAFLSFALISLGLITEVFVQKSYLPATRFKLCKGLLL
jgi:hypothetical protein